MSKLKELQSWLKEGLHLPDFLRDFHDQKDIFKRIQTGVKEDELHVTWLGAHVYTIDHFLWFMAQHGYTLQQCRAKVDFRSLDKTMEFHRKQEIEMMREFFSERTSADDGGQTVSPKPEQR